MHDILEGCVRVNIKTLINHLIKNKQYSTDQLSKELTGFKYGRLDKQNQVPTDLFGKDASYKLSATSQWTFLRIFPLLPGIAKLKNEYVMHLVELQEIWRIILADEFDENLIANLQLKIDIYLKTWSIFYPDVKLIPKQRFLIHYPTSMFKKKIRRWRQICSFI